MKFIRLFTVALVFLLTGAVNLSIVQGVSQPFSPYQVTSQADFPWSTQYVHRDLNTPLDVGTHVSLALRPYDNAPILSYYDGTNGNLMVAISAGAQVGNCGTDNRWICTPVDGTALGKDVGRSTSIDVWGTEQDWRVGISYFDVTGHGVKAVFLACSFNTCLPPHIVEIAYPIYFSPYIFGQYTSLRFNSGGVASIAFYTYNPLDEEWIYYAYPVAADGNCGGGDDAYLWNCDIIDYGELLGQYASLDFSWDDKPYIAYYDGTGGNLKLAKLVTSGNCGSGKWQCDVIDGTDGSNVGLFASLIAPQTSGGATRIAYYDKSNQHLKYYSSSGLKMVVDEMGSSIEPMGISMTMDQDDRPVIAYQQILDEFSHPTLRLARYYYVYHNLPYGNCGEKPPGYSIQLWQCNTIDHAGAHTYEANYVSAKVDSFGRVRIAYTEDVPDYYATSLKYMYQTFFHTMIPITLKH